MGNNEVRRYLLDIAITETEYITIVNNGLVLKFVTPEN
jgi:hypothetical protein